MCFDDIPEDYEEAYKCQEPNCSGNIVLRNGVWECDTCSWSENRLKDKE